MFPNDFDRDFNARREQFDRNFNRAATGIGIAWVVSFLASIAFLIAIVAVAWHFIAKVW